MISLSFGIGVLLLVLSVSCSDGRQLSVSQGTFGGALGRLVSSTYASLEEETDSLTPAIDSCASKMSSKVDICVDCLKGLSCDKSSGASGFLHAVVMATSPATQAVKQGIAKVGDILKGAGKAIYEKYGEKATNALKDGFNRIGGRAIVAGIQNGVNQAIAGAKKIADAAKKLAEQAKKKIWKPVKKIFSGWRRRRSLVPEIDFPKFTEAQKKCLEKCPACGSFVSGEFLQIMRSVCGADLANKFGALNDKVIKYETLVKQWDITSEAKRDLLKEVWVNDATHKVSKIVVWMKSSWRTYYPSSIAVDLYNIDPMYDAIAVYLMNKY